MSDPDDTTRTPPFEGLESGSHEEGVDVEAAAPSGLLRGKLSSIRAELQVPLYRNAYLMVLNTVTTSGLGLLYWVVAAHVYSVPDVGQNTALISAMVLLSNIAQLNFAQVLMRYVPVAGKTVRRLITISLVVPSIASFLVAGIVVVVAHFVVPEKNVLNMSAALAAWFVVSVVTWTLFNLQDAAFIGLRRVFWVPVDNTTFGIAKIALLFPFVTMFAGYGIFVSWTLPVLLSLFPLQLLLYRKFVPVALNEATGDEPPIERRSVVRYIAWDYFGWMLSQMTVTVVPLLVISTLDAKANAYYYTAQIISVALDLFVVNMTTSLVVEAVRDTDKIAHYSRLILKRVVVLVFPAVALLVFAAPLILRMFGHEGAYAQHGTGVLRLLALSTIPRVVITLSNSLSRIDQKTHQVTVVQGMQAVMVIVLSVLMMRKLGINGVGWAVLISTTFTAGVLLPKMLVRLSPRFADRASSPRT